ncbi:MAG TPA: CTP synthase [Treponemataceae bacterium]|nr:CTP synthase [Treponemataceae bacterium]
MSKYILVTGGVCSSLGKGVASSAIGSLLECCGLTVAMMKCDPYINVDAGNMSPYQHGEVYVTSDGTETDLDLGNYSRFTHVSLTSANCITTGKVYDTVIKNERAGRYNGRTVQVIPHITDEIQRRILLVASQSKADVVIVEIGGTVGDIESIPFLESIRQLIRKQGKGNAISIHLTLIPMITGGELKTKPTQHSVKSMQKLGIQPDILLCRTEHLLDENIRKKIARFCNVGMNAVFTSPDVEKTIYELPVIFHEQKLDALILKKLGFHQHKADVTPWKKFLAKINNPKKIIKLGILGKKNYLNDCYKSVREALLHAAVSTHGVSLDLKKIDAEDIEAAHNPAPFFEKFDGIVVPGNYGQRGFLGLLEGVRHARVQKIPFFGVDFGMQIMAIETARNIVGWTDADSTEFIQNTDHPIVSLPEEQSSLVTAGLMKVGNSDIKIKKGSKLEHIYKKTIITERHRNKYACDRKYLEDLKKAGLHMVAFSVSDDQVGALEWQNHPWGIGVQYHPEFISRPTNPHPLFSSFIEAAISFQKQRNKTFD